MEKMNIVIVGHVDHGKSTLVGRLLHDTNSLPVGKIEQIKNMCKTKSRVFEYAYLLDALENEREQGITIDLARCFFKSEKRKYILLDTPGHIEFIKNMVTGASQAESAILLIDAKEGIKENSKRHALLLSMLGIEQLIVCINKMDSVNYNESYFEKIKNEYSNYLTSLHISPNHFIPISAINGENLVTKSINMKWYKGPSVLDSLDAFKSKKSLEDNFFRMPIQDVYKFTDQNDDRRLFVGKIESGTLNVNDEIIFIPSLKKTKIKSIEIFNKSDIKTAKAGESIAFTVDEQIYIKRGEIACKKSEPISKFGKKIRVNLFWMGKNPFKKNKNYYLKVATSKVEVKLVQVNHVVEFDEIAGTKVQIERHDVCECVLETSKEIAFDLNNELVSTSRFVIIDDYEICGGGIIRELLDEQSEIKVREESVNRELNFIYGSISKNERYERLNQKPILILVTGNEGILHKELAKALEVLLFKKGKFTYYIGFGSLKHGLHQDIKNGGDNRDEYLRRLAEVSFLFLDAGLITILSAQNLNTKELNDFKLRINDHKLIVISTGDIINGLSSTIIQLNINTKDKLTLVLDELENE